MVTDGSLGKLWESVSGNNKENGSPCSGSKFSRNGVEVVELIGVPGGIRTLVCAVKEILTIVTN
jgi:hypothetical protein